MPSDPAKLARHSQPLSTDGLVPQGIEEASHGVAAGVRPCQAGTFTSFSEIRTRCRQDGKPCKAAMVSFAVRDLSSTGLPRHSCL